MCYIWITCLVAYRVCFTIYAVTLVHWVGVLTGGTSAGLPVPYEVLQAQILDTRIWPSASSWIFGSSGSFLPMQFTSRGMLWGRWGTPWPSRIRVTLSPLTLTVLLRLSHLGHSMTSYHRLLTSSPLLLNLNPREHIHTLLLSSSVSINTALFELVLISINLGTNKPKFLSPILNCLNLH
jgi:hypothetical protein